VFFLTVVPLQPGKTPFAVQLNNNNKDDDNNNNNNNNNKYQSFIGTGGSLPKLAAGSS
jgi:hypothetical protein